jgi:hypothetical protein
MQRTVSTDITLYVSFYNPESNPWYPPFNIAFTRRLTGSKRNRTLRLRKAWRLARRSPLALIAYFGRVEMPRIEAVTTCEEQPSVALKDAKSRTDQTT